MRVVFCLPGDTFSNRFLLSWTQLLMWCQRNGIETVISSRQSSNVYFVRSMCLGADVLRGAKQKPFNGELKYDYIMWIDSDQVFEPKHFEALLKHNVDIVSGLYLMADLTHFACVKEWDLNYFRKNGCFKFLTPQDVKDKTDLISVGYNGFGWMLIKKGVFENLEYPWFKGIDFELGNGVIDFSSEDVSFCRRVIKKGYKVWVDPTVIVGHEKKMVI